MKLLGLALIASVMISCADSGKKATDNNSALLFLINNPSAPRQPALAQVQNKCFVAYSLANSCVSGGVQQFNPGVGCALVNLKSETTYDALLACLNKQVNDPVQPCNLPQFRYAIANQAIGGALKNCNSATYSFTPSGSTTAQTISLSGALVF